MVALEAMEVLGGNGYVEETPLARLYRDTWAIFGQTHELDGERYMFPWLRLLVRGRYYTQTKALFWSDDYTGGEPATGGAPIRHALPEWAEVGRSLGGTEIIGPALADPRPRRIVGEAGGDAALGEGGQAVLGVPGHGLAGRGQLRPHHPRPTSPQLPDYRSLPVAPR